MQRLRGFGGDRSLKRPVSTLTPKPGQPTPRQVTPRPCPLPLAISCLLSLLFSACTGSNADTATLNVSAAASLTDVMQDLESAFEAKYPNLDVNLNLAASGTLQRQIEQQAPVDVFASAATAPVDDLQAQNLIDPDTRAIFARNRIVVVAPKETALTLDTLSDLDPTAVSRLAIGNPATVPAGRYAKQALENAGVYADLEAQQRLVFGENVRQVLSYAESGNVEAAIVYQTDATASDRVQIILAIPAELSEPIEYPIAVVRNTANPEAARQFVEFVSRPESRAILDAAGFLPGE